MNSLKGPKNILEPLTWLLGNWQGKGRGGFPTHHPFEFADYMHFKVAKEGFSEEPLIHFEEIAEIKQGDRQAFKHWETGYFIPAKDGKVKFLVCHNTGRVEITLGRYKEIDIAKKSFKSGHRRQHGEVFSFTPPLITPQDQQMSNIFLLRSRL